MSWLLPLLLACGGTDDPPAEDSGATPTTTVPPSLQPVAVQAPDVPAVWWIELDTPQGATTTVHFGLDPEQLDRTTPPRTGTGHRHPLLGLKAGRTWHWQVHASLEDGTALQSDIFELATDPPPPELLLPTLTAATPDSTAARGFVQFSQLQPPVTSWVLVVDGEGDLVWWRRGNDDQLIVTSRASLDRTGLLFQELPLFSDFAESRLHRVALDGSGTDTTRLYNGHHDFLEWPDGTLTYLQFVLDDTQGVVSDALVEIPEGTQTGAGATTVFSWLDDYPIAPWTVCEHTGNWVRDPSYLDWTHTNSLMLHPDGQHYLVMSKFHDAVLKIRRTDGVLVWQLGGEHTDFTLPGGASTWDGLGQSALWSHGHMSHAYPAPAGSGWELCLAVFDNGYHRTPEHSELIEVCLDETARTAERTWRHPDPGGGFTPLMGDLRRLDDGWLAGWSQLGRLEELADDGSVRWQLTLGPGASSGRVQFVESLDPLP